MKSLKEAGIQVELGIKSVITVSTMPALNGSLGPVEQSADVFNEMVVLAATEGTPLSVSYMRNAFDDSGKPKNIEQSLCAAGKYSLYFDPTGNINPCLSLPIVVGNVKQLNLKKFWLDSFDDSEALKQIGLKYIHNIKLKDVEPCGTEDYCKYCIDACPGNSFLENGSFFTAPKVSCFQAKARKAAAELLSKGLSRNEICIKLGVPVEFGYI